jgi:hypothetical protein
MDSKMAEMAKYGLFDYLVEYPIWVSIKRTLTGKLVLYGQNLFLFIHFLENVQKPSKREHFQNQLFSEVFGRFLENGCIKSNSDHLAPTYPSKSS